jgi:hypothetical protein
MATFTLPFVSVASFFALAKAPKPAALPLRATLPTQRYRGPVVKGKRLQMP